MLNEDNIKLTPRQKEILQKMLDEEEQMVVSGGEVWVGDERTNTKVLYGLLKLCFISEDSFSSEKVQHYNINGSGINYLIGKRPIYEY